MFKISIFGPACTIAALVFWKTALNRPSFAGPSVRAGADSAPGQIAIPSNLPDADPVGAD
jgi:hypothetical protein